MKQYRDGGGRKKFITMSWFFMLFMFANSYAAVNTFDLAVNHPPIPLLDEQGNHVLESHNPYSPKKSCEGSGCHDYEALTHAYHFQQGRDEASDDYGAKRGLPFLVSPGYYGGYTCMGGNNQIVLTKKDNVSTDEFADYGTPGFVKRCESCHAGGGWAEKDREGMRYDEKDLSKVKPLDGDYYAWNVDHATGERSLALWDWKKSGVVEADCMLCHADFNLLKLPEDSGLATALAPRSARSALAGQGFFRQAASGLMEYVTNKDGKNILTIARSMQGGEHAEHGGSTASMQLTLDENGMPIFNWHADAFDEAGRVTIPMLRFPDNKNCMECHVTSNSRRGFYGFGESAQATIASTGEDVSDGVLEDDYQDDVHKGRTYVEDNGQSRDIENCNACHSRQYYKSHLASVDLDADHNFLKGNSDNDVRNDLDYNPNAKSCEACHILSKHPIIPSGHDTLLEAHRELWKNSGDMAGYTADSLTQITQTHFDVVSCQACHITGKKSRGNEIQIMYRYRIAEDGKSTMVPYNPRLRYYWKDKNSGRVLVNYERNSVFQKGEDADGNLFGMIVDPISGEQVGRVGGTNGRHGFSFNDPDTYEGFVGLKKAYDSLLRKKGYNNPDTTLVWTESNEYIISHNTRPAVQSVQCEECHERKQSGAFSSLVSPNGIMGTANVKKVTTIPDNRLVSEGIITLDLPYFKLQPNGDVTQNVSDILFATKVDPFMSLLKNSSASEIIGDFQRTNTATLLGAVDSSLSELMRADFTSADSFIFKVNKGNLALRNMAAAIDGNTINNILFPTYRGALGIVNGAEQGTQDYLTLRHWGQLRSNVFYFEVRDSTKTHVEDFNGTPMYLIAAYKGNKTRLDDVNVIVANWDLTQVSTVARADLVQIKPADEVGDGYVIFKTNAPGYFAVADK